MPTWGCIVLVASFAEGQQALRSLQLLEVLVEYLQHAKAVGCCATCKREVRYFRAPLPSSWHVWKVGLRL